jgi:hypothetical protein
MTGMQDTQSPAPRRTAPALRLTMAAAMLFAAAAAVFFYFRSQENRFASDDYLRANELYKQAFMDYQRGGPQDYRAARDNLVQTLELQKTKTGGAAHLPYQANALTHNASGLLAILSALLGECGDYEKYRALTERIAAQDWAIDVMDKVQQQVNDEEKAQLVFTANQQILEAGLRCKQTGLPVKSFNDSPSGK